MIGRSTLIWIALASVASVILYQTSYEVQEKSARLAALNKKIVVEQDAIQVLKAEWAYLNDPARLESLVAQHLLLQPTTAAQIVTLDQIPEKAVGGVLLSSATPVPIPGRKPGVAAPTPPAGSPASPSVPPRKDGPVILAGYGIGR